jgi:hypothetical protein
MRYLAAALLVSCSTACLEPFSNEDLLFLKSLPTRNQLELGVPSALNHCTSEPSSIYYVAAATTSASLNAGVYAVLDLITEVAGYPPTKRTDDARVWGPFPGDDPNVEFKLTVERIHTSTTVKTTETSTPAFVTELFHYTFEARRDGPFIKVIEGVYAPSAELESGMGVILLNFEQFYREVDPQSEERGLIYIGYDNRFGEQTTQLVVDSEVNLDTPFAQPEGLYSYHLSANGDRTFAFVFKDTIEELTPDNASELFWVRQRYLASGEGRAEVAATGGDLGDAVIYLTECWDACFQQTFFASNLPDIPVVGTINACAGPFRE